MFSGLFQDRASARPSRNVSLSGDLQHWSMSEKRHKHRFFVLDGTRLFIFGNRARAKPKPPMTVTDAAVVTGATFPQQPAFDIVLPDIVLHLIAPSFPEMRVWMDALCLVSSAEAATAWLGALQEQIASESLFRASARLRRFLPPVAEDEGTDAVDDLDGLLQAPTDEHSAFVQELRSFTDDAVLDALGGGEEEGL